ncbi:LOW QUALITY PROTEIN: mitochondrial substrate carrier family protein E [Populus alba x Populus x berolinensis]|nr:LOW QUALITY PROTEIN: mitochondrial substrate carrier family protein E [Populus alba x Populus x berolinensis]
MPSNSPTSSEMQASVAAHNHFFIWREFWWGAIAGAFGEGMMHPVDTVKTRIQSQAILSGGIQARITPKSLLQMVRAVAVTDGARGFYRGITPGVTGSLATGATYFGFIESAKKWIEESHPSLGGHWAHFIFVSCWRYTWFVCICSINETTHAVHKGQDTYWTISSIILKTASPRKICVSKFTAITTRGMFPRLAERVTKRIICWILVLHIARDEPFAGLMVMFYEAL